MIRDIALTPAIAKSVPQHLRETNGGSAFGSRGTPPRGTVEAQASETTIVPSRSTHVQTSFVTRSQPLLRNPTWATERTPARQVAWLLSALLFTQSIAGGAAAAAAELGARFGSQSLELSAPMVRTAERNRSVDAGGSERAASRGPSGDTQGRFAWELKAGVGALWTSRVDLRDVTAAQRIEALRVWIEAIKADEPRSIPDGLRKNPLAMGDAVLGILQAGADRDERLHLVFATDFKAAWTAMSSAARTKAYDTIRRDLRSFRGDSAGARRFLERLAGRPFTLNRVDYFIDGPASIAAMSADLARPSGGPIQLAVFELSPSSVAPDPHDVAWALVADLCEKARRQKVYVYLDEVGTFGFLDPEKRARGEAIVSALKRQGVDVTIRNSPLLATTLDHRKIMTLVVAKPNGARHLVGHFGSQNIGFNYQGELDLTHRRGLASRPDPTGRSTLARTTSMGSRSIQAPPLEVGLRMWHDGTARVEGPEAEHLRAKVEEARRAAGGAPADLPPVDTPPIEGGVPFLVFSHDPGKDLSTKGAMIVALASAAIGQTVDVATPYFTDIHFVDTLREQAENGVHVRLVLPRDNDMPIAQEAARGFLDELIESGVRVFEFPGMSHIKVLVAGDFVVFGSANLDGRSVENFEIVGVVHDAIFAQHLRETLFDRDVSVSQAIEAFSPTLLQRILAMFGDVL